MASSLNHCMNDGFIDAPYTDKGIFGKGRGKTGEKKRSGEDKRWKGKKEKMGRGVKKRGKLGKPVGSTFLCTQRNYFKLPSLNFPIYSKKCLLLKVLLHKSDHTLNSEIPSPMFCLLSVSVK